MKLAKVTSTLVLVSFLCLVATLGGASALKVEVTDLSDTTEEGQVVDFTLSISNFPQGYILSFDTDLERHGDSPLFNVTNMSKETYEEHFTINTSEKDRLIVHMVGEVPKVTEVKQCDGVTLIGYEKTTGYAYYRVELCDTEGHIIETDTKTFNIKVPELEGFRKKLAKIDDPWLRIFLTGTHEKGLVNEANELADYWLKPKPYVIPLLWFIVLLIGAVIISVAIGIRIGGKTNE
ncbi:MAG: hypothetical protein CHKLHMKO_00458 [Candidatus Argoarchaeum ethanivorans]|uniref:Uncharacterized protein n=1 Tax=Candidatus Argoarchaeum ethanivorans TaxID=2608793 RepID=A0A811TC59_9EURY|nr:MAG: hypothetical protein CHKLHMKO_00458 [Candidatus Argoarchaeum ethanivorans]